MDKKKSKVIFNPPLIIKVSISEIFVIKEEFQNHISEYSLKFVGTNNNKFNIYNLSYILKKSVDLIPLKTPLLNSITIYLMKSDKVISKGILYLNKNSNEQIVQLKHVNIKFNYILDFIDFIKNKNNNNNQNNKNKIINKNNSPILKKNNILNNQKTETKEIKDNYNLISKKIKDNICLRNLKKINKLKKINENNNYRNNSCVELGDHANINTYYKNENYNNEQKTNVYSNNSTTIDNKDFNFANNWVNNTKLLLKRVNRYLTLRSNKKNSKKKFKKCLSVKNIKAFSIDKNEINKSLTYKKLTELKFQKKSQEFGLENKNHLCFSENKNNIITSYEDIFNSTTNRNSPDNNYYFKKYYSLKKLNSSSNRKENQFNLDKTNYISQYSSKKFKNIDDISSKKKQLYENNEKNNFKNTEIINDKQYPILSL